MAKSNKLVWIFGCLLTLALGAAYTNCGGPHAFEEQAQDGNGSGDPNDPGTPPPEFNSYIYVANHSGVRAFSLDANKQLVAATVIGTPANSGFVLSVAADPLGQYVFTASITPNTLLNSFSVNQTTGALTLISSLQFTGRFPYSLRVDPSGNVVYAADNDNQSVWAFRINRATGATTLIGEYNSQVSGSSYAEIGMHPSGSSLYVMGSNSIRNLAIGATGALSLTQGYAFSGTHFAFSHDGRFIFGGNFASNTIQPFAVAANGALTAGANVNVGQGSLSRVQTDATGSYLFAAAGGTAIAAFEIGTTGALTFKSSVTVGGANFFAITGDHTGTMVYATNRTGNDVIHQFQLDRATGALTKVGGTFNTGGNVYGMTFLKIKKN